MSRIFGTLTPAPFNFTVVRTLAFVFALPAITLILMGISLYFVVKKLERVAELQVIRESGEVLGSVKKVKVEDDHLESFVLEGDREVEKEDIVAIDDAVMFEEKEVYSEAGEFLGYVKNVSSDEAGEVTGIIVQKKDVKSEIPIAEVLSVEKIIIVKAQP
jgi:sporulation protein YlmC with PRC-barrel domain